MSLRPSSWILRPRSLRRRLVLSFALFGGLLALVFGAAVWGVANWTEDVGVRRQLQMLLTDYERRLASGDDSLPVARHLWATFDLRELPAPLPARLANVEDGYHELEGSGAGIPEAHVLVAHLKDGRRLWLALDATAFEALDRYDLALAAVVVLLVFLVSFAGAMLGRLFADRLVGPVERLAEIARRADPSDPPHFADDFPDDETGVLARSLEDGMRRAQGFLVRERRFTRDASHELRSPLAVIRGAAELIGSGPASGRPEVARPLGRIHRAVESMEALIEAFLWLAREDDLAKGAASLELRPFLEELAERRRPLLQDKPVEVVVEADAEARLTAPPAVLDIAVGNLITNAFRFVREGRVTIRARQEASPAETILEVIDSGPGIPHEGLEQVTEAWVSTRSDGSGLGLAIVEDLCGRFGWTLELESRRDGDGDTGGGQVGTVARLRVPLELSRSSG